MGLIPPQVKEKKAGLALTTRSQVGAALATSVVTYTHGFN